MYNIGVPFLLLVHIVVCMHIFRYKCTNTRVCTQWSINMKNRILAAAAASTPAVAASSLRVCWYWWIVIAGICTIFTQNSRFEMKLFSILSACVCVYICEMRMLNARIYISMHYVWGFHFINSISALNSHSIEWRMSWIQLNLLNIVVDICVTFICRTIKRLFEKLTTQYWFNFVNFMSQQKKPKLYWKFPFCKSFLVCQYHEHEENEKRMTSFVFERNEN